MRVKGYRGRLTTEHFLLMRMPERFWRVTFDGIQPSLKEFVRSYLKNLDERLDSGDGLLLWGNNGCGKTSAACYIAKEVRRTGASVLVITAAALIDSVLEKAVTEEGPIIERARTVDLLLLDDLGKEHAKESSDWSQRVLESLIRERCSARLTTLITTNKSPREMIAKKMYVGSMFEVLKEAVYPIHVKGEDLRLTAAESLRERIAV